MNHELVRVTFKPGTRLGEAWRSCGIELVQPRDPPWHAWRDDGTLVMTVWRNDPHMGRWIHWHSENVGFRLALREPGSMPDESDRRLQKLRSYNIAVQTAARAGAPIIVLVLQHRQNERGQFQASQRGAAVPVEAWSAWIGEVNDRGNLRYSVVGMQWYPCSPFRASQ